MPPKDQNLHLSLFSAKENPNPHQDAAICPKPRNPCEKVFLFPHFKGLRQIFSLEEKPPHDIHPVSLVVAYSKIRVKPSPSAYTFPFGD
jgi:hypothetical protein